MSLTPSPRKKSDAGGAKGAKPQKRSDLFVEDYSPEDAPAEPGHEHDAEAPYASHGGADDALGLYLKQMGSIPLLSREKELFLARRLEWTRRRYRRALLFNWWSIRHVV